MIEKECRVARAMAACFRAGFFGRRVVAPNLGKLLQSISHCDEAGASRRPLTDAHASIPSSASSCGGCSGSAPLATAPNGRVDGISRTFFFMTFVPRILKFEPTNVLVTNRFQLVGASFKIKGYGLLHELPSFATVLQNTETIVIWII